jgi:hypothetical protein
LQQQHNVQWLPKLHVKQQRPQLALDLAPTREAALDRAYKTFSVERTPVVRGRLPEPVSFLLTGRVFAPYESDPPEL